MSITPYIITNNEWTPISTKGLRGSCWLDFDSDDEEGRVDIRIFSTSGTPTDADLTNSPRVFKPIDNKGYYKIDPSSGSDIFYARAFNAGDQGTLLVSLNPNSSDVNLQDQTSPIIILRMTKNLGDFTLDGVQTVDSFVLNVETGHGASVGEAVCLQEYDAVNELPRFFQAQIRSVTTTTITVDRPLDYAYGTGTVLCAKREQANICNEVGTTANPIYFEIEPLSGVWDITRLIIQVFTSGTMDDGKFGSIDKLSNGLQFRKADGYNYNLFNIKSNGSWSSIAYDTKYVDKPPAGTGNGFACRLTLAGQNKIGVTSRIDSSKGEKLQCIISDDLSAFGTDDQYIITVEGHVVE